MKAIIVGGGIIGLSSAYYLKRSGWEVTVIDQSDFLNNCSYGNAGYVCPSHFVPLASPGIIQQGLRWMLNKKSPFYIQPRLSWPLMDWGLKFVKSATAKHVADSAIPLRDAALVSQHCYEELANTPGFDFAYERKGLFEYFLTNEATAHAHETIEKATSLGLDAVYMNAEEVQALEPQTKLNIKGAVYFKCDSHLYPNKLMRSLISWLQHNGVTLKPNETITAFEKNNNRISKVITSKHTYEADAVVIATGSWSREVAQLINVKLPLMPGRGYSITLENSPYKLNYPAILVEGRVAVTPMDGNKIRFGGTMEITNIPRPPQISRVEGILNTVKQFLPEFTIPLPDIKDVWYGYRPCSPDGLPYIGRLKNISNCIVATGHAMIGLSLGAGTGQWVTQLLNEEKTSTDLAAFEVERFS
ncbi:MAG: FAD-binding oxidoreductase [Sphingobacteriales bacterium]|nr:FAD-binding oxidoreductase [Sphingobacteriales bacterium]MBI3717879.1 FAD-binding oxidoreductase [Sphingobacteriales bacterium]